VHGVVCAKTEVFSCTGEKEGDFSGMVDQKLAGWENGLIL
jgi:hypothetical protein